ncbi:hypothetical protein [Minwuia sp. IMCC3009]|uniref:hypothetical protein n=1 Tax=Minwuia sp. IMCC3009 TaxID=3040674 RepID=UPI00247AC148|nr:hypothetical protein [Minwuia sp. IMCC3009]
MLIVVDPKFESVAAAAVARIRILVPTLNFEITDQGIDVSGDLATKKEQQIRRLLDQFLYQQRIFEETLSIRERIYNG